MDEYTKDVSFCVQYHAPKGQEANSPGQRPGLDVMCVIYALKGQKPYLVFYAFALTGRRMHTPLTRGDTPG